MSWKYINKRIKDCMKSPNPLDCLLELFKETDDGMVAFKLAELFESKGGLCNALKYYKLAHERFPLDKWRKIAQEKINDIKTKLTDHWMGTLFIVSCTKSKIWETDDSRKYVPAKEAYIGDTMKLWLMLEESKKYPWIIFSSKYGFIEPDHPIKEYDIHFKDDREKAVSDETLLRQILYHEFKYRCRSFKIKDFETIYFIGSKEYYGELKKVFDKANLKFEIYPKWASIEKRECKEEIINLTSNLVNLALNFLELIDMAQRVETSDIPETGGVYAIIHDGKVIYIESTNNLKRRILNDHLKGSEDMSVLRRKLLKEFGCEEAITEFLSKCNFAFMPVEDTIRKALEHYLIAIIKPKYNIL